MISLEQRAQLTVLYNEKHRHYHNLDHIYHCLRQLDLLQQASLFRKTDFDIMEAAIWFHDAVYDPQARKGKNEKDSAELAFNSLTLANNAYEVSQLVLNTTHDHEPETALGKYVVDIDMSGFGLPWNEFDKNSDDIRKEYSHVPYYPTFLEGRLKFLESLKERKTLFYTSFFQDLYEQKAQDNIKYSIELLRSQL